MNSVCTFFGHRDAPSEIQPMLTAAIREMIEFHHVNTFYVGSEGRFDMMAQHALTQLQPEYPRIQCSIVLAYLPDKADPRHWLDTIFPEGFESFPPRFAVSNRNRWMLRQSDCVITYIRRTWGGAAQFAAQAERQGKTILRL